jgi:hypothetical protein
MTKLRTRFEDLAGTSGPPTRLSADAVYIAAHRRRRRRQTTWTATGVLAGALALGVGLQMLRPAPEAPQPAQPTGGPVVSVAATDAQHLYAGVRTCPDDGCKIQLIGSDDGGRTWTVRQDDFGDGQVDAPAPGVLVHTTESEGDPSARTGPKIVYTYHVSTDGGRTWRDLQAVGEAVAAVPANGWVQCSQTTLEQACQLLAADPATGRLAPLAGQPPLSIGLTAAAPGSPGTWITGQALTTDFRVAVALSHDRGRTWSLRTFGPASEENVAVSTVDGMTAYVVVSRVQSATEPAATAAGNTLEVLRTTDGGQTWASTDSGRSLPSVFGYIQQGDSYVSADGSHLVLSRDNDRQQWYVSNDSGATYRAGTPAGLGDHLTVSGMRPPVQTTVPGVYLAFDDRAAYTSADGLHWTRVAIEPV